MIAGPIKHIVAAIYALLVLVGSAQVLSRYALGFSLPWSEEFIRYAFFWSVMLTAALVAGDGAHLKVDYVSDTLSPRGRRALELFNDCLMLIFAGALIWFGGDLVWRAVEGGSRSPAMGISMGWIYLAFPVGGTLLGGMHVWHMLHRRRTVE
ncbi:MAG: TRAP transporter small permease [Rhizobiaceae bacterium]|nr:TRAP transporter small permease [Rhizobiaceae bacterium]